MQKSNSDRKPYITYLTVIATVAVVFLHANSCFWVFTYDSYWLGANIVECVMYFAVPVFFMISGATLIDYRDRYSTKEFFLKRINKTLIPFFAWSLIAFLSMDIIGGVDRSKITLAYIWNGIINHEFIGIYWFFIPLFNIYLVMPLFSAVAKENRKSVFLYLIAVEIILDGLVDYFNFFSPVTIGRGELEMGAVTGPIMYALIGYVLSHFEIPKKYRVIIYGLGIIGLLVMFFGTYFLSTEIGRIVGRFKDYYRIMTVMYSSAVFLFVKQSSCLCYGKYPNIDSICEKFAGYAFPIYLIHFYFMQFMLIFFDMDDSKWTYRIGAVIISIPASIAVAYILRRIPILRRIVPS